MATIRDVADEAKVSVATVSAVINQNKFVSEKLTKRVEQAITKLNYIPNKMAQGLAKQKTYVFAYLVPSIANPIFAQTVKGMEEVLSQQDFTVTVVNTDFKINKYLHDTRRLISRVDGFAITAGHHPRIKDIINELEQKDVPVVIIHSPTNLEDKPTVIADDINGVKKAVKHLAQNGHQKIGFIGVKDSISCQRRWQGYQQGLRESNLEFAENLSFFTDNYSRKKGMEACYNLLEQAEPTAIFAASDVLAVGVLEALHHQQMQIPEEIAVIGYDDTLAKYCWPPLTTVHLPCKEIGKQAARALLRMHYQKERGSISKKSFSKIIKQDLIIRDSSKISREFS